MKNSIKIKKDYNSLLDSCISYEDVASSTEDINYLINYYSKNILMITYAKLMLKGTSLTSKGLEGSVVVFALPVGVNDEGKVIFSINEAVVQADTAKKVNAEVQKIYRNSLKNVSQDERFNTTEELVISEIKANQEEISKLSNTKSLNISDEKYTWDEFSKKFFDTYGYEPSEFNYSTWIEYKTTMIDTRTLRWNNEKKDKVVEQLHDGAREVQGMTMNQLLQPYDLLGVEEISNNEINDNIKQDEIETVDNNYGFVEVDDDNFDIEAFMQPTININNNEVKDEESDSVKSDYDEPKFKFINTDIATIDDEIDNKENGFDSEHIDLDTAQYEKDDIQFEELENEVDNFEFEPESNDLEDISIEPKNIVEDDILFDLNSTGEEEKESDSREEVNPEDLFKRIKFIKYDDLVKSENKDENDNIDEFFERLEQNFEKTSYKRKM